MENATVSRADFNAFRVQIAGEISAHRFLVEVLLANCVGKLNRTEATAFIADLRKSAQKPHIPFASTEWAAVEMSDVDAHYRAAIERLVSSAAKALRLE
jgi:hypothetical protein